MALEPEIVDPKDVPFDIQPQAETAAIGSPLEIECASMVAHGATTASIAVRFGLSEIAAGRLRRKPNVKRLIERYKRGAGSAGSDLINVGYAHVMRRALVLADDPDKQIALKAIALIARLAVDLQKMPASGIQVNMLVGLTAQGRSADMTDDELREEALKARRVMDGYLKRRLKEKNDDA